jgi:hypothetical protein
MSNALCASYCKLWLNVGHGHGSPAERKMAMVIGWPLLKLKQLRKQVDELERLAAFAPKQANPVSA